MSLMKVLLDKSYYIMLYNILSLNINNTYNTLVKSENQAKIWPLSIVFYLLPSDQLELVRI